MQDVNLKVLATGRKDIRIFLEYPDSGEVCSQGRTAVGFCIHRVLQIKSSLHTATS